ncbi:unnamed protein product [Discosporangium mesarthrocarpum]
MTRSEGNSTTILESFNELLRKGLMVMEDERKKEQEELIAQQANLEKWDRKLQGPTPCNKTYDLNASAIKGMGPSTSRTADTDQTYTTHSSRKEGDNDFPDAHKTTDVLPIPTSLSNLSVSMDISIPSPSTRGRKSLFSESALSPQPLPESSVGNLLPRVKKMSSDEGSEGTWSSSDGQDAYSLGVSSGANSDCWAPCRLSDRDEDRGKSGDQGQQIVIPDNDLQLSAALSTLSQGHRLKDEMKNQGRVQEAPLSPIGKALHKKLMFATKLTRSLYETEEGKAVPSGALLGRGTTCFLPGWTAVGPRGEEEDPSVVPGETPKGGNREICPHEADLGELREGEYPQVEQLSWVMREYQDRLEKARQAKEEERQQQLQHTYKGKGWSAGPSPVEEGRSSRPAFRASKNGSALHVKPGQRIRVFPRRGKKPP